MPWEVTVSCTQLWLVGSLGTQLWLVPSPAYIMESSLDELEPTVTDWPDECQPVAWHPWQRRVSEPPAPGWKGAGQNGERRQDLAASCTTDHHRKLLKRGLPEVHEPGPATVPSATDPEIVGLGWIACRHEQAKGGLARLRGILERGHMSGNQRIITSNCSDVLHA